MKNFYKLKSWITDSGSEFFCIYTEREKLEFEFIGHDGKSYFFETAGFPKDTLTFKFVNREMIRILVTTESSFLDNKYELTSDVLSVEFTEQNAVEIKTNRFNITMCY